MADLARVEVVAEPGTEIFLIDSVLRLVARSIDRLAAGVDPGPYKLRFRSEGAIGELAFIARGGETAEFGISDIRAALPKTRSASDIPFPGVGGARVSVLIRGAFAKEKRYPRMELLIGSYRHSLSTLFEPAPGELFLADRGAVGKSGVYRLRIHTRDGPFERLVPMGYGGGVLVEVPDGEAPEIM